MTLQLQKEAGWLPGRRGISCFPRACEGAGCGVPLVQLPAGWAAGALQPYYLVAAIFVVTELAAVLGGLPPLDDAVKFSQGVARISSCLQEAFVSTSIKWQGPATGKTV